MEEFPHGFCEPFKNIVGNNLTIRNIYKKQTNKQKNILKKFICQIPNIVGSIWPFLIVWGDLKVNSVTALP